MRRKVLGANRVLVAASILSADFGRMADDAGDVLRRGADLLHVDVMDGHFVPNLTMGPDMVRGLRKHFPDVFLDVHLMVERPDAFVGAFAEAGADLCSFHIEVCHPLQPQGLDPQRVISQIHELGMMAGLVVNPGTPAETLDPWLGDIELALVMSVNPGRSGQSFMPEVLPNVSWLKSRVPAGVRIEIDGGINPSTVRSAREAGADMLVSASALFGAADRTRAIEMLRGD